MKVYYGQEFDDAIDRAIQALEELNIVVRKIARASNSDTIWNGALDAMEAIRKAPNYFGFMMDARRVSDLTNELEGR